jgi:hypothetical protein
MGDRCYMQAWVRREDYNEFCNIVAGGWVEPREERRSWIMYEDGEANYGAFDQRMLAAEKGLIFVGESGPGMEYDGELFYADGKEMTSQDVGRFSGHGYIVPWDKDTGKATKGVVQKINKFDKAWREMYNKVREDKNG